MVNVECQDLAEADEAIAAGANIVMLDNIVGDELHATAKELKERYRGKREFLIETSGGIVEGGLVARLGPDIDILSTSAVHQVRPICQLRQFRLGLMARIELSTCRFLAQDPTETKVIDHHSLQWGAAYPHVHYSACMSCMRQKCYATVRPYASSDPPTLLPLVTDLQCRSRYLMSSFLFFGFMLLPFDLIFVCKREERRRQHGPYHHSSSSPLQHQAPTSQHQLYIQSLPHALLERVGFLATPTGRRGHGINRRVGLRVGCIARTPSGRDCAVRVGRVARRHAWVGWVLVVVQRVFIYRKVLGGS